MQSNGSPGERDALERILELSLGAEFPAAAGRQLAGGYWVIPISLVAGCVLLFATHRLARRWLEWAKVHVLPQSLAPFWRA